MRVFEMPAGDGLTRGRAHGEEFRGEIQTLAELRTYLTRTVGGFRSDDEVIACAREHLPVLREFDADLYGELAGIAEGAAVSPEAIVVLNHYTDLRDLGRSHSADAGGCSMVWTPTPAGLLAGQTWDMHASAMPYVALLRDPGDASDPARPGAWILSLVGCLGMAAVSDARVAVMINNLTSTDAVVGVVWSALVRRAARAADARAAFDVIANAPVGSGHHYLCCDGRGALALETSGTRRRATLECADASAGAAPYVHTNHCLDAEIGACSVVSEVSTTYDRYDWLHASVREQPVQSVDDLWTRLGSVEGYPRSVCTIAASPENPHGPATCGGIAVDFATGEVLACAGLTHGAAPTRVRIGARP